MADFQLLAEKMTPLETCDPETEDMCLIKAHFDEDFVLSFCSPKLIRFSTEKKKRCDT